MGDTLRYDISGLKSLISRFDSPKVKRAIADIPKAKAIAALVAQAIADNFDKEGPGWAPLKGATLRRSVAKGLLRFAQMQAAQSMGIYRQNKKTGKGQIRKKDLAGIKTAFNKKVENILVKGEKQIRAKKGEPGRMILQKTGTLKKAATTQQAGHNIYRVEGNNLFWGVDLVYARAQNRGNPKINLPARPFLVVRDEWMQEINDYMVGQVLKILRDSLARGE